MLFIFMYEMILCVSPQFYSALTPYDIRKGRRFSHVLFKQLF